MPRCCDPIQGEFKPCYASIMVSPDLKRAVEEVEQAPLQSSITAWCTVWKAPYLLTGALHMFPTPAAHHAHMIVLSGRLKAPLSVSSS